MPFRNNEDRKAYDKKRRQTPEYKEKQKLWRIAYKDKARHLYEKYEAECKYKNGKYQYPETLRKCVKKWRLAYPERHQAHLAVKRAKYSGILVPGVCSVCSSLKVEAHHEDYSKPLEVIWLCKKHHAEADMRRKQ